MEKIDFLKAGGSAPKKIDWDSMKMFGVYQKNRWEAECEQYLYYFAQCTWFFIIIHALPYL